MATGSSSHYCLKMAGAVPKQVVIPAKPASPPSIIPSEVRKKACGLTNLGNTCYMNSGLQCLAHTFDLTRIFLSDLYLADINTANPIGTGGKLVKAYASLIKEIWTSRENSIGPWGFKRELGAFVPQFYGANQHDSHELITYLLDFLHEDLNRVHQKPIISEFSQSGMSESEVADKYWSLHFSRNQSVIVDFFHGQYRSEVVCPVCRNISLTFDPFVSLSVPFAPKQELLAISAYFVPGEITSTVYTLRLRLPPRPSPDQIRAKAAALLDISINQLLLYSVFCNVILERLEGDLPLKDQGTASLVLYEIPENGKEADIAFMQFSKAANSTLYRKTYFAMPRLVLLAATLTLYQVHLVVFSLLNKAANACEMEGNEANIEETFQKWLQNDQKSLIYKLNLCNLKRNKSENCDFCGKSKCDSCLLPISHDISLHSLRSTSNPTISLAFDVEFHMNCLGVTPSITSLTPHSSLEAVRKEEKQQDSRCYSLYDCLDFAAQGEKLDSDNEVFCSVCSKHMQATKQMTIYRLPPVLIVHLKRFKTTRTGRQKDDRMVNCPLIGLDLRKYCKTSRFEAIYDLYAVSNHYGGLSGGHYTAMAKHEGRWYSLDDATVREIRAEQVVTSAAYVVFYRARTN